MYVKRMTYTDFNGVERTEDFYFNLTKAELLDLQMSTQGGLDVIAQRIVDSKDNVEIYKLFKQVIRRAIGVKSDDGRYLRKGPEVADNFEATQAYSDLIEELFSNADFASEFIRLIVPSDMSAKLKTEYSTGDAEADVAKVLDSGAVSVK